MAEQSTMIPPEPMDRTLHTKALAYVDAQRKSKASKHGLDAARDDLVAAMEKKGRVAYRHADVTVELVDKGKTPKVSVVEHDEDEPPI